MRERLRRVTDCSFEQGVVQAVKTVGNAVVRDGHVLQGGNGGADRVDRWSLGLGDVGRQGSVANDFAHASSGMLSPDVEPDRELGVRPSKFVYGFASGESPVHARRQLINRFRDAQVAFRQGFITLPE